MVARSWYQNERDYHAQHARWWLVRALQSNAGPWDGAEAGYHASQAAHYERLERAYRRHVIARSLHL